MNVVNALTVALIKKYESLHDGDLSVIGLQPALCPAGVWTVGYGHALRNNKGVFLRGDKDKAEAYRCYQGLTELGANNLLAKDLSLFSEQVSKLLKVKVTDNEFGAMVSLSYNIGINGFATSSVLKYVNEGQFDKAANSFMLWNKAMVNGIKVVMKGLTNRRQAERDLFVRP